MTRAQIIEERHKANRAAARATPQAAALVVDAETMQKLHEIKFLFGDRTVEKTLFHTVAQMHESFGLLTTRQRQRLGLKK